MARIRPHVKVGSSHDPAVRRGALVSRAQRSTSRAFAPVFAGYGDALQTRDRYGASSWRSRISDASLADARAASRPGHTNSLGRARTLFTFQTAHLVPAAHFCARGLQLCFAHPNRGVGGAPIRHPYILTSPQVAPCYFKGLAFFSCARLPPPLPSSGNATHSRG